MPLLLKVGILQVLKEGLCRLLSDLWAGFQPDHGLRPGNTWGNILIDKITLLVVVCIEEQLVLLTVWKCGSRALLLLAPMVME